MVTIPAALVADAGVAARRAADRYGLRVTGLDRIDDLEQAVDLLCGVWGVGSGTDLVNVSWLRALSHSGNYVVGAYAGTRLVGAAVAFFGDRHLHSHITGVDRTAQAKGVGFALKQHQRAWALRRGLNRIGWTFDPLVRRNAHFNLVKLGAFATAYLPDFYGVLADGINTGDASDRLYVSWLLDAPAAVAAAAGEPATVAPPYPRVLVDTSADRGSGPEEPVVRTAPVVGDGPLLVAIPEDVESLRREHPEVAARWRYAVRDALTDALDKGWRIAGMTGAGRYVLMTAHR